MAKITLRLPDDLHTTLVIWAREDDRSLNSMIITLLRAAPDPQPRRRKAG